MEFDSFTPAMSEWVRLVVGVEDSRTKSAEERHHRQVELPVTAEASRVDQPAVAVAVNETVAGPQITVQE